VRDNIHSSDLIRAFHAFFRNPRSGEVYNIGGGLASNCSMLEAIALSEDVTGNEFNWKYVEENRRGDHIWWVSDLSRFREHYPEWNIKFDVPHILREIYELNVERWSETCAS
jgi:CDP-paratose 2-epimerase